MYVTRSSFEPVQLTPEGRFLDVALTELPESQVVEVCDVCEEPADDKLGDALGQFGLPGEPHVAAVCHYQCGIDEGYVVS